jgi:hypothetical protein
MRGVGVNPVGVLRVAVFFFFIERTSTEATEQTPAPAQERGPRRRPEPRTITHGSRGRTPITDESWRLRVRGADGSRATSIRAGGDAPGHQRLLREAWKRAPLLHYGSQVNPVRRDGRSHQLVGPTLSVVPLDLHRFQLRPLRDDAGL